MNDTRWERLKAVFVAAAAANEPERGDILARECADDPDLRREVEALLLTRSAQGVKTGGGARAAASLAANAEAPATDAVSTASAADTPDTATTTELGTGLERPGAVIGRYKLLQQIGEGGFGAVFLAEQCEPVVRKVALKIIKLGMDTKQVIARFEAERQALALMDHPHIARVLDAGATDAGRPYFVMEFVKGVPITRYCDANNLPMRERLELFKDVCHAVQHAHQKGVIHRDLKPSNVLVSRHDDKPVVKVIDFGIAKATGGRLTEKTAFTELGQMIGTPAYMSPEQAGLSDLDVDTRSDIYTLGVLLYELLTGATPFDVTALLKAGYGEIQRIIREVDPPKPSTRVSTLGETLPSVAAHRKTEARKLGLLLRGDLDWIVMKALEKDRTRRYETASNLAQDVQRHLNGEPVLAAPPSVGYRVRKFVRRNKGPVSAAVLIMVMFVLGLAGTTWQWTEARRAQCALQGQVDATLHALRRVVARYCFPEPYREVSPGRFRGKFMGAHETEMGGTGVQYGIEITDDAKRVLGTVRLHPVQGGTWDNPEIALYGPDDQEIQGGNAILLLGQFALELNEERREQAESAIKHAAELQTANAQLRKEIKRARLAEASAILRTVDNPARDASSEECDAIRQALNVRIELLGISHPDVADAAVVLWSHCKRSKTDYRLFAQIGDSLFNPDKVWVDPDYRLALAVADLASRASAFDSAAKWYQLIGTNLLKRKPVLLDGIWPKVAYDLLYKSKRRLEWADDSFANDLLKLDADTIQQLFMQTEGYVIWVGFSAPSARAQQALAIDLYRHSAYAEAISAVDHAVFIFEKHGMSPDASSLAILGMANFKLGRIEKAQQALAQLRQRMDDVAHLVAWDDEAKALRAEAEALIDPPSTSAPASQETPRP